nr:hypothetical protein [Desulfobacterales bacterium]
MFKSAMHFGVLGRGAILGVILLLSLAGISTAADCPNRGNLDVRYCDADGDLVADPPADKSQ